MSANEWVRVTVNIHRAMLDGKSQAERERIIAEAAVDGFLAWQTKAESEELYD